MFRHRHCTAAYRVLRRCHLRIYCAFATCAYGLRVFGCGSSQTGYQLYNQVVWMLYLSVCYTLNALLNALFKLAVHSSSAHSMAAWHRLVDPSTERRYIRPKPKQTRAISTLDSVRNMEGKPQPSKFSFLQDHGSVRPRCASASRMHPKSSHDAPNVQPNPMTKSVGQCAPGAPAPAGCAQNPAPPAAGCP